VSGFALLCPGQGGQHAGMLAWALGDPGVASVLRGAGGPLAGADWIERVAAGEPLDHRLAQTAIVAAGAGAWERLRERLPQPDTVAGYSLGELTAWTCAGSWSLADALGLAARRADAMLAATPDPTSMAAVTGASAAGRAAALDGLEGVHPSIVIDADHAVLTGRPDAMSAARARLESIGATWTPLPVTLPSHSPMMAPAAAAFAALLRAQRRDPPRFGVVRGVDGRRLDDAGAVPDALSDSLVRTIRWDRVLETLAERDVRVCLELPPGRALSRMVEARGTGIEARAVEDFRSVDGLARWVADRV